MESKKYAYENIKNADLFVDAIYMSPRPRPQKGGYKEDVLTVMFHNCRNTGGFRVPHRKDGSIPYISLHLTGREPAWPDSFDQNTGILTYYGDNRKGGENVEKTSIGGNKIMREMFDALNKGGDALKDIPPIFVFQNTGEARDVRFIGLAVPGIKGCHEDTYFRTVWRTKDKIRFPNYVGNFSILDLENENVKREWIDGLFNNDADADKYMPKAWKTFLKKGLDGVKVLAAPATDPWLGVKFQLPSDQEGKKILRAIQERFGEKDYVGFEKLAAILMLLMDSNYRNVYLTRPTKDGGRDAIAEYVIKTPGDELIVECAMEAKCYDPDSKKGVGVKETSRLISRIRNRQFGILITTSYINKQAYKEVKEDGHPILFITGKDIVNLLREKENITSNNINQWLSDNIK